MVGGGGIFECSEGAECDRYSDPVCLETTPDSSQKDEVEIRRLQIAADPRRKKKLSLIKLSALGILLTLAGIGALALGIWWVVRYRPHWLLRRQRHLPPVSSPQQSRQLSEATILTMPATYSRVSPVDMHEATADSHLIPPPPPSL